eukprot:8157700-Lingulodinium_polyedra.AAC.1
MESHSVGLQPGAATTLRGGLRLEAPVFSPSDDGIAGTPLHRAALAAAKPSTQERMLGDQLYPTIAMCHPTLAARITG